MSGERVVMYVRGEGGYVCFRGGFSVAGDGFSSDGSLGTVGILKMVLQLEALVNSKSNVPSYEASVFSSVEGGRQKLVN